MNTRFPPRKPRGMSLVEVLIAVLIFSLGMVGLGGLLIFSIQANHMAYLQTQVTFLAHSMADRMSANPIGMWNGYYNSAVYPLKVTQDCSAGCAPKELATYDQQVWSTQLKTFLPDDGNLNATINCLSTGLSYTPAGTQMTYRPPYGGECTMKITWTDSGTGNNGNGSGVGSGSIQTFAWVFQP